jgi:hypothetical protein
MALTTHQVLPQNQDQSYIYGLLAFPLLELGRMDEAERAARKGLDINKNDVWSQHNVCLVTKGLSTSLYLIAKYSLKGFHVGLLIGRNN